MKLSISMPDELLKKLDDYADANYTTRSGAITMMVNSYLDSREMTKQLGAMTEMLQKLNVRGELLSEDESKALEAFQYLSTLLPTK